MVETVGDAAVAQTDGSRRTGHALNSAPAPPSSHSLSEACGHVLLHKSPEAAGGGNASSSGRGGGGGGGGDGDGGGGEEASGGEGEGGGGEEVVDDCRGPQSEQSEPNCGTV